MMFCLLSGRETVTIQVVTGMALDEHEAVQLLEASDWQDRRRKLSELGRQDLPP
jgi:hypothetical protein